MPDRGGQTSGNPWPEVGKSIVPSTRGVIFWGDEIGLRPDGAGGRLPVVRNCHKRASMSLISTVANRGELRWMIANGAVNAPTLIRFLGRLFRETRRKVFLILDRLRVHRVRLVWDWLAEHSSRIEVHYFLSLQF